MYGELLAWTQRPVYYPFLTHCLTAPRALLDWDFFFERNTQICVSQFHTNTSPLIKHHGSQSFWSIRIVAFFWVAGSLTKLWEYWRQGWEGPPKEGAVRDTIVCHTYTRTHTHTPHPPTPTHVYWPEPNICCLPGCWPPYFLGQSLLQNLAFKSLPSQAGQ